VNDLGTVITIGVDRTEAGKLSVTLAVALPGAASGGKGQQQGAVRRSRVILHREAATISEAIRLAELTSSRRLAMDHSQILMLGERFARGGVDTLLDFLLRSPQVRLSTRIILVRGATPFEVLEIDPLMRSTQAEALRELEASRAGLQMNLKDFLIALTMPHQSPIMPTLNLRPHLTSENGVPGQEVEMSGAAVFSGDRLSLVIDEMETRVANWLLTDARDALVTAPCPGGKPGLISVRINRAKRAIEPVWAGGRLSFRVRLQGDARITDLQCDLVLDSPAGLAELDDAVSEELEKRTAELITRLQEAQVDPFGFGEQVRAKLPAVWQRVGGKQWLAVWASIPVHVDARFRIVHLNMTNQPPVPDRTRISK